jgi:hypothetical protein
MARSGEDPRLTQMLLEVALEMDAEAEAIEAQAAAAAPNAPSRAAAPM